MWLEIKQLTRLQIIRYCERLEKENKKLKEEKETLKDKIEFLTQCLDDRDKSIALMQKQEYPFWPVKTISEPTNWR